MSCTSQQTVPPTFAAQNDSCTLVHAASHEQQPWTETWPTSARTHAVDRRWSHRIQRTCKSIAERVLRAEARRSCDLRQPIIDAIEQHPPSHTAAAKHGASLGAGRQTVPCQDDELPWLPKTHPDSQLHAACCHRSTVHQTHTGWAPQGTIPSPEQRSASHTQCSSPQTSTTACIAVFEHEENRPEFDPSSHQFRCQSQ